MDSRYNTVSTHLLRVQAAQGQRNCYSLERDEEIARVIIAIGGEVKGGKKKSVTITKTTIGGVYTRLNARLSLLRSGQTRRYRFR